ncbi:MAG: Peptide chain release factor 1 [Chlamydiales bacterium]|nr:Peptide chain release factor 1 [Chlamydiales bacterium]MCH9620271.1 Peptide chain release factor 1 [Chlamydiales bacterium]MCH9622819.1 Peptide chain release factor 1 [Chlamydiales bacterium]
MISKTKWDALQKRMNQLNITPKDLIVKSILGSGAGGQKINKTSSTIYIKHLPTGIEVRCGKERSRELNRYRALSNLCEKLETILLDKESKKEKEIAKIRRQKRRRSRRSKEKSIEDKRHLSGKKTLRKPPSENEE